MKPDETRTPIKHRHEKDQAAPTVIHDPEQDMNLLERWLRHAMANQVQFWSGVVALVAVLVAASFLASGMQLSKGAVDQAWTKLDAAKTAEEREEIARDYPNTPAQRSALLLAASEYYMKGFADLPSNKDVALPTLKKALDLFQKVAEEAPADAPQGRAAALGAARTHEARNEIDKAIAQYKRVAGNAAWKGTPEALEAARLAALLEKPESVAFYKDLYAYKPVETTLPPGGSTGLDLPSLGSGSIPGLGGGSPLTSPLTLPDSPLTGGAAPIKLPDPSTIPPPPPTPEPSGPKTIKLAPATAPAPKAEMPAPVPLAPKVEAPKPAPPTPKVEAPKPAPPAPKVEAPKPAPPAPKVEAPKPAPPAPKVEAPKAAPKDALPDDPFSPKPTAPKPEPAGTLPEDPFSPAKK